MNGEYKRHFQAAIKEFLLALRSLTDAGIARLESKTGEQRAEAEQAQPSSEDRGEE